MFQNIITPKNCRPRPHPISHVLKCFQVTGDIENTLVKTLE